MTAILNEWKLEFQMNVFVMCYSSDQDLRHHMEILGYNIRVTS